MTTKTQPTLNQRIASLYRAGQTPVPYSSNTLTEVMMCLYMTNKHGIHDPSLDDIREQYQKYGRARDRLRSKMESPSFCVWELYLHYDEKDRLIKDNSEEYTKAFFWKLRELIDANPGKKVVCLFNIAFFTREVAINGHLEIVVYDPALNTLEHLDSNQLPKQRKRKDPAYFACCEISTRIVRDVGKRMEEDPIYINNEDIYTGFEFGIQSMEAASDLLTSVEKEGYCLMWAMLFADLTLTYQDEPIKNIVQSMIKKATSKQNGASFVNDYLAGVIRGYVVEVSRALDVSFTDETSKERACIKLARTDIKEQTQSCICS